MNMTETNEFVETRNEAFNNLLPYIGSLTICGRGELSGNGRLSAGAHKISDRIAMYLSELPIDYVMCSTDDCCDLSAIIMTGQRKSPIQTGYLKESWFLQNQELGAEGIFHLMKSHSKNGPDKRLTKKHLVVLTTSAVAQTLVHTICDILQKHRCDVGNSEAFACRIEFEENGEMKSQIFP